jgi:hypothetical protein
LGKRFGEEVKQCEILRKNVCNIRKPERHEVEKADMEVE